MGSGSAQVALVSEVFATSIEPGAAQVASVVPIEASASFFTQSLGAANTSCHGSGGVPSQ